MTNGLVDDEYCPDCKGSGEGQSNGSTCKTCKGTGTIYPDYPELEPRFEEFYALHISEGHEGAIIRHKGGE